MATIKQDTTKIAFSTESTSPTARAIRLKKLRNLANLSREEICDIEGLNPNTFKGWELGRFGGLTKEGAERIIARVAQENVLCSLEWLLQGVGNEPIVLTNYAVIKVSDENIQKELTLFHALAGEILYAEIPELAAIGHYQTGDVVAGVKISVESIPALIGTICLVEDEHHEITVKKLLKTVGNHKFLVSSLINDTQTEMTLISAARIIRHYRLY